MSFRLAKLQLRHSTAPLTPSIFGGLSPTSSFDISFGDQFCLETNLASRWEGVRVPQASGKSPDFPGSSPNFFPGSSLTVELNSNPEVPRKFPKLPRKFPKLPQKFPDLPGGQPLSLGSLTPSPDSQKHSLICPSTDQTMAK